MNKKNIILTALGLVLFTSFVSGVAYFIHKYLFVTPPPLHTGSMEYVKVGDECPIQKDTALRVFPQSSNREMTVRRMACM